jgi:hypothetical protein
MPWGDLDIVGYASLYISNHARWQRKAGRRQMEINGQYHIISLAKEIMWQCISK